MNTIRQYESTPRDITRSRKGIGRRAWGVAKPSLRPSSLVIGLLQKYLNSNRTALPATFLSTHRPILNAETSSLKTTTIRILRDFQPPCNNPKYAVHSTAYPTHLKLWFLSFTLVRDSFSYSTNHDWLLQPFSSLTYLDIRSQYWPLNSSLRKASFIIANILSGLVLALARLST